MLQPFWEANRRKMTLKLVSVLIYLEFLNRVKEKDHTQTFRFHIRHLSESWAKAKQFRSRLLHVNEGTYRKKRFDTKYSSVAFFFFFSPYYSLQPFKTRLINSTCPILKQLLFSLQHEEAEIEMTFKSLWKQISHWSARTIRHLHDTICLKNSFCRYSLRHFEFSWKTVIECWQHILHLKAHTYAHSNYTISGFKAELLQSGGEPFGSVETDARRGPTWALMDEFIIPGW